MTSAPTPSPAPAPAPAPLSSLTYETTLAAGTGWPAETKAVVAAAAVVSFLALLTWGGSLWRYLQPSAFGGSLILKPWPSLDFARFVLHAVLHVGVIAGALTAPASQKASRRILLAAALCLLALALYQFATFSIFQTGLTRRREGPDRIVMLAMDGARLVGTNLVHGLLVLALARPFETATPGGAGWRRVTQLVVAVAAVDSVVRLADAAALVWLSLQPSLFKAIGAAPWTAQATTIFVIRIMLHLTLLGGAAAALAWRRHRPGGRLVLVSAAGLVALALYSYVYSFLAVPPPGFPVYKGAEFVTTTVNRAGTIITAGMIHGLVIFALARRHARN